MSAPKPLELADWLVGRGTHFVTTDEVSHALRLDQQSTWNALSDLQRRGLVFSPARGAYVPIPPEYRAWGAVPASHFVDPLMRHLKRDYYVGLLSAAEVYGVAHQRPQVFQVVVDKQLQPRRFGRIALEFVASSNVGSRSTRRVNTPTGAMTVAAPSVVYLDLLRWVRLSGGISNAATVVSEMVELDLIAVAELAAEATGYPAAVAARAGWLLSRVGGHREAEMGGLAKLASRRSKPALLAPGGRAVGEVDRRWNLRINVNVEVD